MSKKRQHAQKRARTVAETAMPRRTRMVQVARRPLDLAAALVLLFALSSAALSAAAVVSRAPSPVPPAARVDTDGAAYVAGALVKADTQRLQIALFVPPVLAPADLPEPMRVEDPPDVGARVAVLAASLATFPKLEPAYERLDRLRRRIHYQPSTRDDCLPRALVGVLFEIAERFGDVKVHSTYRDPRLNARVGGVPNSLHLHCRAIDFSVNGNRQAVAKYLSNHPKVGGFGIYPGSHFHIDNGPRRYW